MADKNTFEGTTTVGITCKDGVVFASERRASMGNLVAHKVAEKIFKIRNGKDISLEAAAAVSSNILHSSPAYVQTLIGGVDDTGASIYSLDAAGGMIKDTFISTGSGSTFAYGVLEDRFHEDITVEEAKELALRAIKAATERDTYSGNGFLVAEVTKDGYKMLEKEEVESIIEKINS